MYEIEQINKQSVYIFFNRLTHFFIDYNTNAYLFYFTNNK